MSIKIGDKIRFLNNVGGGIVRRFEGKDKVMVEDDNGFDYPVFISECVLVNDAPQVRPAFQPKPAPAVEPKVETPKAKEPEEVAPVETKEGEQLNTYLAFLPLDEKNFQQTRFETYLINDSNYYLLFNYMNRISGSWTSRYNGLIEPNTRIFLEEFGKEELNDLERVCVQYIAFKKDKPYSLKNSVSVELRIDTVKFYKMHCFMANPFFEDDAMVYPLVKNDLPLREMLVSTTDLQEAMQDKIRLERKAKQPIAKKQNKPTILEIDLHAGALLDTFSGLENADILQYQLKTFHEEMQKYASKKGQKIVFIHGKGNGVLRRAIEKELNTKYKTTTRFQDASFKEYGFGATLVTIL